ncbi:MAG: hypothetical protein IKT90_04275 [Clostridia bacterium]|nr:hypothetical protein [Clostridia bacterium]
MDKKVTGIVAYITLIGWAIAYLIGDREGAKFHMNQALVLALAELVVGIVGGIIGIVGTVLGVVMFVLWVIGIVGAIQGKEKKVPLLGDIVLLK